MTKLESEKWLQEHRPSLSVDVASANRFISAAIPELTAEQKHALRLVRCNLSLCDVRTAVPACCGVTDAFPSRGKPSMALFRAIANGRSLPSPCWEVSYKC